MSKIKQTFDIFVEVLLVTDTVKHDEYEIIHFCAFQYLQPSYYLFLMLSDTFQLYNNFHFIWFLVIIPCACICLRIIFFPKFIDENDLIPIKNIETRLSKLIAIARVKLVTSHSIGFL